MALWPLLTPWRSCGPWMPSAAAAVVCGRTGPLPGPCAYRAPPAAVCRAYQPPDPPVGSDRAAAWEGTGCRDRESHIGEALGGFPRGEKRGTSPICDCVSHPSFGPTHFLQIPLNRPGGGIHADLGQGGDQIRRGEQLAATLLDDHANVGLTVLFHRGPVALQ